MNAETTITATIPATPANDLGTLERALLSEAVRVGGDRDGNIAARYLWGVGEPVEPTLEELGAEFGLTRERIRQVRVRISKRLSAASPAAAELRFITCFAALVGVAPASQIEAQLRADGHIGRFTSLERVLRAAADFGLLAVGEVRPFGTCAVFVPRGTTVDLKKAYRRLRDVVRKQGAASLEQFEADAPLVGGLGVLAALVVRQDDVEWLDASRRWFWFAGQARNALVSRVRKVLGIAGRIDVRALRTAIERDDRIGTVVAPDEVLLALCRALPYLAVEGDEVIAHNPRALRDELETTEATLAEILFRHGPILGRERLTSLALEAGINPITIGIYLGKSLVLAHIGRSLYALVGTTWEDRRAA